ncbi:hypothetical protein [Wenzhouxiangella limi]|nr:hypothetical protein [Wenzhouxiangella limi]
MTGLIGQYCPNGRLQRQHRTVMDFAGRYMVEDFRLPAAMDERHETPCGPEGLNRIVKIVKNRASGFRHLDAFSDMIYLSVGDLDLPGPIPARFRTL